MTYRSRTWTRKAWEAWYRSAIRCRLEPVKKAAIKRHLDGILTAVVDKLTNARAESINAGRVRLFCDDHPSMHVTLFHIVI